uniref:Helicase HerA central domain-containing protein n=1 Tax=Thermogemmatispora argillosa TaxID=2045280 RepID=A0A455SYQ4_9CHLR|nr:hypothetical protein KTA_04800 [Thermogemmatispora argillosa]
MLALTGGIPFVPRLWVTGIALLSVLLLVHGRVGGSSLAFWLYWYGRFWWLPKRTRFRPPSAAGAEARRKPPRGHPVASQRWVPAGELQGHLVRHWMRGADGRMKALTCWALLEVQSYSTLRLLPRYEQERLLNRCQRFLDGLSFPVKFLWIVEALDPARDPALQAQQQALVQLKDSPLQHLQRENLQEQLHQQAHCSSIRHLVVVSASSHEATSDQQTAQGRSLLHRMSALLFPRQEPVAEAEVERALRIRLGVVKAGLEALDLQVSLLSGAALLRAFASCLAPGSSVPSFEVDSVSHPHRPGSQGPAGRWVKRLRGLHGELLSYISPRPQAMLDPGLPLEELLAPVAVDLAPQGLRVQVGKQGQQSRCLRTYEVVGLPAEVSYGWLEGITNLGIPLIIMLQCQPLPNRVMLRRLELQRTKIESQRLADRKSLRLTKADVEQEATQLLTLIEALASNSLTLCSIQLLLMVHASTLERLEERTRYLLAHLRDQQVRVRALAYRHDLGWQACFPTPMTSTALVTPGAITLPSDVVATCLTWSNSRVGTPSGAYLGISRQGPQGAAVALPVYLNPWDGTRRLPNPHVVICGESGMGKSWLAKTLMLGLLCTHTADVVVLDRDGDYDAIHAALGEASQRINLAGQCPINPLELPYGPGDVDLTDPVDLVAEHIEQHLLPGLALLYGESLSKTQEAVLTHAARVAYRTRGLYMEAIRTDPQVLLQEPPTFAAFLEVLRTAPTASEVQREMLMERFDQVAYLFSEHTTLTLTPLTIFAIGKLDERWYPFMNYVIYNFVQRYRAVQGGERYLAYVVEEASYLLKHPAGRRYLEAGARGFRKLGIAQITISQHPTDFLEAGQVVLANSGTWFLLGMQRQAAQRLQLPDELERLLEEARPGRVVFRCGRELAPLDVVTYRHSPLLRALLTTDPRDRRRLASLQHRSSLQRQTRIAGPGVP